MTTDGSSPPSAPPKPARPKPRKLEVDIRLSDHHSSSTAEAVRVSPQRQRDSHQARGQAAALSSQAKAHPPAPGFDARLRFEKKGRGGQPVLIVFSVLPEALRRAGVDSLDALGRRLREKLACGGTVDGAELILQYRDRARLEAVLSQLGIRAQASGGF